MFKVKYILQYFIIISLPIGIFISCSLDKTNKSSRIIAADSVSYYLKNYKSLASEKEEQNLLLLKAYEFNNNLFNDTLKKKNSLKIAYQALINNDTTLLKRANNLAYQIALKQKDTSAIAEYHWNKAALYNDKLILDSAYYHYRESYKNYDYLDNANYSARMLFNMAVIEGQYKDYLNSESKLFLAINKYDSLNKTLSLHKSYKLLGVIYAEKGEFGNAKKYHDKALDELKKIKNKGTYNEQSLNDIGLMYQQKGDYKNAISYFNRALDGLKEDNNSSLYAKLKSNLGYSLLLDDSKDTTLVRKTLYEALKIREADNDQSGIIVNKLHLAEYYLKAQDTTKALVYAKDANTLAVSLNNNDNILSSLILLSKVDPNKSGSYLGEHVKLTSKLQDEARKANNKFARIQFETEELEEENKALTTQQSLILITAVGSLFIVTLLYFMRMQRAKNRELKLEQDQRKANEEIYKLMLKQQSILEQGRINERNRISEELHDGVLGKIFGTRMGLAFLNVAGDPKTQDQYKKFIQELQDIEKEMRIISHDLKNEILTSTTNFISIIENLLEEQTRIANFGYTLNKDNYIHWNEVSDDVKLNIYRIIQEAIQNINKHAKNATMVNVSLEEKNGLITLFIKDNGEGFDSDNVKNEGIGLRNMNSRANALKGNFSIESKKDKGTKILVTIPSAT